MIKNNCPLETDEQIAFVTYFGRFYPGVRIFAIPNGTRANIRAAIKAKKEGVSAGVPDLYVPAWKTWIEMKRQKGSSTSPEQKDWHEYLKSIGDHVIIAKGCADALDQIKELKFGEIKDLKQAVEEFLENECQMTDHVDDYRDSFLAGYKWAKMAPISCN